MGLISALLQNHKCPDLGPLTDLKNAIFYTQIIESYSAYYIKRLENLEVQKPLYEGLSQNFTHSVKQQKKGSVYFLAPPPTICVTLGNSLNLSVPQCLHP